MNHQTSSTAVTSLLVAPSQVLRGSQALSKAGEAIARLGQRPLVVGGDRSLAVVEPSLQPLLHHYQLHAASAS